MKPPEHDVNQTVLQDMAQLTRWFPDLGQESLDRFQRFRLLLEKYNQKLNLVSDKSLANAARVHFADAILGSRLIKVKGGVQGELYDLGSGNGFPGIVFAILYPEVVVHLVEVDNRKSEFLKVVASELALKGVVVKNQNLADLPAGSLRFGVSRGLANLSRALLMTRKLFAPQGLYFHFKSEEWVREISEIPTALCSYWTPDLLGEYQIPDQINKMVIIRAQRTSRVD